jgi:hypothetical protein
MSFHNDGSYLGASVPRSRRCPPCVNGIVFQFSAAILTNAVDHHKMADAFGTVYKALINGRLLGLNNRTLPRSGVRIILNRLFRTSLLCQTTSCISRT